MKFSIQNSSSQYYCVEQRKACIKWVEIYFRDCLCNTRDELSFLFGLISLVCWGVAEIPQIISNFKTKSSHGISFTFLLAWILGDIFNLVGCLLDEIEFWDFDGDIFNLVGCFLEPATLATQFYTAVLYTTTTVILVVQSLYYSYLSQGRNCQEMELNQEVEEVKTPLIPRTPTDSAIPIPNGTSRARVTGEVYSCRSARSMAWSIRSYAWPVKSVPSAVGITTETSDDEENPVPAKGYVTRPIPILRTAKYGAFFVGAISQHHVTQALTMGLNGRNLLQLNSVESVYGEWLGWMMAAIYMGGRLPQICLNIKRGSVEGLNPFMFVFALVANATYVASIVVRSVAWYKLKSNMPWLMDAVGCVVLDIFGLENYAKKDDGGLTEMVTKYFSRDLLHIAGMAIEIIILQYVYYSYFRKRSSIGEEYEGYVEANKD